MGWKEVVWKDVWCVSKLWGWKVIAWKMVGWGEKGMALNISPNQFYCLLTDDKNSQPPITLSFLIVVYKSP